MEAAGVAGVVGDGVVDDGVVGLVGAKVVAVALAGAAGGLALRDWARNSAVIPGTCLMLLL